MACAICVGLTPSYTTKLYCVFPHHANTFPLLCTLFLSPWFALAFTSYSLFLYYPFYTASLQQRTNHFPSLIFTFPHTYAGSPVTLWLGLHAGASRLYIPPNYTAPYLTTQLPSLSFVRSCFHISSVLFSRSTCYSHTIPSIPRSCNNVLSV